MSECVVPCLLNRSLMTVLLVPLPRAEFLLNGTCWGHSCCPCLVLVFSVFRVFFCFVSLCQGCIFQVGWVCSYCRGACWVVFPSLLISLFFFCLLFLLHEFNSSFFWSIPVPIVLLYCFSLFFSLFLFCLSSSVASIVVLFPLHAWLLRAVLLPCLV